MLSSGWHKPFYQLVRITILTIFLYIAYVHEMYNEIFTPLNGIFSCLGWVDVDFFSTSALHPSVRLSGQNFADAVTQ